MKLDNKTKSLIAVGASVTANCQPCLKHHVAKALENGAEGKEIAEAIKVGKAVRSGAASQMDKLVAEMELDSQDSCSSSTGSCCGNTY